MPKSKKGAGLQTDATSNANSTADRAIDILLCFTEDEPFWTMAQISERFSMPRTTTYRYLNSLRSNGLIIEKNGRFSPGPKIIGLARVARAGMSVVDLARPHLESLSQRFGETVSLNELIGHEIVSLDRLECRHPVRMTFTRGDILPWPSTANAKALLAFADRDSREELIGMMTPVRYTTKTIATKKALLTEMKKIRKQGFAVCDEERDEGVRGVSAPIHAEDDQYVMTIGGPAFRLSDEKLPSFIEALSEAAETVTQEIAKVRI